MARLRRGCDAAAADCAALLADVRIATNWGLTYTEHAGFWLWGELPALAAVALFLVVLTLWVTVLMAARAYRRSYRSSFAIDLAVAWLTVAIWGHLTDRLLFGAARDWLVTPIGVANLPHVAIWPAVFLFALELWRHPPARRLLRLDPRRWRRPTGVSPATRGAASPGTPRPGGR